MIFSCPFFTFSSLELTGNVLAGVGIAVAGMATGIGMVAFAEAQVRLRLA